jgi:hypothetical protein
MISAIFERFVEQTPVTVMVRAIMERSFAPEQLEKLFEETAFRGMEIVIEPEEWFYFSAMTVTDFADMLRTWVAKVNLKRFLKSPRGKKKPQEKKPYDPKHLHLSTSRLLAAQ